MKLVALLVSLLAVQVVNSQLLSTLCTLGITCSSTGLAGLLGSTTSLTIDVGFTVNSALTLRSVTTSSTGALTVASGSVLQVTNSLTVASQTTVTVAGSLVVSGSATVSGSVQIGSGSGSSSGSAQFQSGLTIQSAANLAVYGSAVVNGSLDVASGAIVNIASGGAAYVDSNVDGVEGNVTVSGSLVIGSGTSSSSYTQSDGYLILGDNSAASTSTGVQSSVTIDTGATLCGTGNINGNLVLEAGATIAPGNSPGTTYVNGDVTFSSTSVYKFEVDNDNNKYDRILATGRANLNGYVRCTFLNSIPPSTSFTALTYTSRTGKFSSVLGDLLYVNRWSENDNTVFSTQFVFNSAKALSGSLAVVLLGLAASLL